MVIFEKQMRSFPIAKAYEEIAKLEPERRMLPLRILELFDGFFVALGYEGTYAYSAGGGAHYFTYEGKGSQNNEYRIEIEFYWDEINFTIYRALTFWEKFFSYLKMIAAVLFCFAWIALIIGSVVGLLESLTLFGEPASYTTWKSKKPPRDFTLLAAAYDICPATTFTNTYTPATMNEILTSHKQFIEAHLIDAITGKVWMGWWNKKPKAK